MTVQDRHRAGSLSPADSPRDLVITVLCHRQVVAGYVYGESCSGTRAVYELGMSGKPIFNVNSNCSTGSSALYLACSMIRGGSADCTMAVGFEKMQAGSLSFGNSDREGPIDHFMKAMTAQRGEGAGKVPAAPWLFGSAGRYHMEKYGSTREQYGLIAVKNHRHSVNNPYAQFQKEYTLDEVCRVRLPAPCAWCLPSSP